MTTIQYMFIINLFLYLPRNVNINHVQTKCILLNIGYMCRIAFCMIEFKGTFKFISIKFTIEVQGKTKLYTLLA